MAKFIRRSPAKKSVSRSRPKPSIKGAPATPALPSKPGSKSGRVAKQASKVALKGVKPVTAKSITAKSITAKSITAKSITAKSITAKPSTAKPWTKAEVFEAFSRFRQANPDPKGELEHLNPFTLLVAVVLSAQATDAGVNRATRSLFQVADTPQKMLALGEDRLRDYIRTIGLYRTKAKNVIALSEKLIANFGGEVPRTRAEIESLPGAGRKTANVVLNMAFGEHTMAVDTHVFRVGNRTGLAPGRTPLEVELGLEKVIPAEFMLHAHHWLILHGRYTCLARKPRCGLCLISDLCRWPEKTA
jgi:endonuclease III